MKDNLHVFQNKKKQYADQHRVERHFQVNDLVYLRLNPYKKTTIKVKGLENLKPRFYGPYKVVRNIGKVAYELQLLEGSKIHNVFHVLCLNKVIGQHTKF